MNDYIVHVKKRGDFSGDPLLRKMNNLRRWILEEPLAYLSKAGRLYVVAAHFVTDGASIPRFLWWLWPPFGGEYDRAAIIHDYLYKYAELFEGKDDGHISRSQVDALFREMMQADEVRKRARNGIWLGVRLGGWKPWAAYREEARIRAYGGL